MVIKFFTVRIVFFFGKIHYTYILYKMYNYEFIFEQFAVAETRKPDERMNIQTIRYIFRRCGNIARIIIIIIFFNSI